MRVRFGVYSGDPLLSERRLAARLKDLGPARRDVFFADEITPEELLLEIGTPDLFGEARAVVVRWADPWRGERELAMALRAKLWEGVAVFFLGEDLRGPLAEAAEEAEHFPRPTGRALRELCEALLSEAGLPAYPFLVDLLVEACEGNTLRLAQEVEKFRIWKGGKLPRSRLWELCFFGQPQPYEFLDAVGNGDFRGALQALDELLRTRWNPQALFNLLVGHLRSLLLTLSATEAQENPSGPDWLIRRRLAQAHRHGEARLIQALALLQELDVRIKLGELDPEDALHLFILRWVPV
ncbi:MAG: DNA polymerase III subunit delta [Candidatus Bipolaricaulaceae bacterium]